jgi:hypothetical protein
VNEEISAPEAESRDLTYHGKNHDIGGRDYIPSINGVVPVGGIILWSGAADAIPRHWALCDGNNNTPNLLDRFVMAAGGAFAVDATGGTSAHVHPFTHAITQPVFAGPTGHTITQPVVATHVVTPPVVAAHAALGTHYHLLPFGKNDATNGNFYIYDRDVFGITDPGVGSQSVIATTDSAGANPHMMRSQAITAGTPDAHSFSTALAITNLTHPLTTDVGLSQNDPHSAPARTQDVVLSNNNPHSGGAVEAPTGENKYPPYYALCYIMRTQ